MRKLTDVEYERVNDVTPEVFHNHRSLKSKLIYHYTSTFFSNEDYEKYFTFKNRKYSIEAEYIENVRTPTHKSYPTLDLVPRSPRDDFYIGYGNESRIHRRTLVE